MRYDISIDSSDFYFIIKTTGIYTVQGNLAMLRDLVATPQWKKGCKVLLDHRDVTFKEAEVNDLTEVITATASLDQQYGASRCAIVASKDGIGKISMYKYDIADQVNVETRIFTAEEYDFAKKWLII